MIGRSLPSPRRSPVPPAARLWLAGLLLVCASAQAIENTATATLNGIALDVSQATVTLTRVGVVAAAASAEISPNEALADVPDSLFTMDITAHVAAGHAGYDQIVATLPTGFGEVDLAALRVDNAPLTAACPAAAPLQYCASAAGNVMTVTLNAVVTDAAPVSMDLTARPGPTAGLFDVTVAVGLADGSLPPVVAAAGNADGDDQDADSLSVDVRLPGFDPGLSELTVSPPLVVADGVAQSMVIAVARDSNGTPVAGIVFELVSDRGALDTITAVIGPTGSDGRATGSIRSLTAGIATVTATGQRDGLVVADRPVVTFTSGQVLHLTKDADRERAVVGDYIVYTIAIRNQADRAVHGVRLIDTPAVGLKYVAGSARLDGDPVSDPARGRPQVFDLGTIAPLVDANGNGIADPGEPGYARLSYRMLVGAGALPGEHRNTAYAVDVCDACRIANEASASVAVTLDAVFDLGTVIGKVWYDADGDGWQDTGEPGIAGAMVALDDGTYALTDAHGRYHFPAVRPGQRLIKINLRSLPGAADVTGSAARVLSVTPGLMARASFGVDFARQPVRIGRDGVTGIALTGDSEAAPVLINGTTRTLTALINGTAVTAPQAVVELTHRTLADVVTLNGANLDEPVQFRLGWHAAEAVAGWRLEIGIAGEAPLRVISGAGALPPQIQWDGRDGDGRLLGAGAVYQYQLALALADGREVRGERVLFGVNREHAVEVALRGGAFRTGSHELTPHAEALLRETATQIRALPEDRIIIEGHTDAMGEDQANDELSLRRAQAALAYLVEMEELDPGRFQVFGHGEHRPLAGNDTPRGRERNRRVEIKGRLTDTDRASLDARLVARPQARIGDRDLEVGPHGRFHAQLNAEGQDSIEIRLANERAQSLSLEVPLPRLQILQPAGESRLPWGARTDQYRVRPAGSDVALDYTLVGRTAPGNAVEMDGAPITVDSDGYFRTTLELDRGANVFGFTARNSAGFTRIVNLTVHVADRETDGPVLVVEPVPALALMLPPEGVPLPNATLVVPGVTDPGNRVVINDTDVAVATDGRFLAQLSVPPGDSRIVARVFDPEGYTGSIEHHVNHEPNDRFFMALADGKFGQLTRKGSLVSANGSGESVTEGRIAYYFKGTVLGKYLITSAFDSGQQAYSNIFAGLDGADNRRLIANIDPETVYPVYGDSSTLVYDAQSQGRFYLSVESRQLDVLVGNYPVNLNDTELAAYQRTLYGAQLHYRSADTDAGDRPVTELAAFAANVDQAPVRDELRATGGSLYFLSHRDVIEGSEQVALAIRDADTGLILSRTRQQRNRDYTIKYPDGRILFNRPIASYSEDGRLVGNDLLGGDPVFVEIDYETAGAGDEQQVSGVRVRRGIGDRLSIGATRVDETLLAGDYQLTGVDAELNLAPGTRLVAEAATSSGNGAVTYASSDGGFTFNQFTHQSGASGNAWKLAAEVDAGRYFGRPDRVRVAGYVKQADGGYVSRGGGADAGQRKYGLRLAYQISDRQQVQAQFDRQQALDGPGSADQSTVQWGLTLDGWLVSAEVKDNSFVGAAGEATSSTAAAVRVGREFAGRLSTSLEHQQTLRGVANDQTTVGVEYRAGERLALNMKASVGTRGRAAEAGARINIMGSRLYLTRRLSGDRLGGRAWTTVAGTETPVGENGQVYSEYQWTADAAQARHQSVMGIRRRWDRGQGLSLMMSAEHSLLDDSVLRTERNAVAAGFSYDRGRNLVMSSRNEWRRERGGTTLDQWLSVNHATYRIGEDFSFLGKLRVGRTSGASVTTPTADFEEVSVGLAYRPVASDRFNALARYTRIGADPTGVAGQQEVAGYTDDVVSADWAFAFTRRWEWVGKQAWRVRQLRDADAPGRTATWLSIQRMNLDLPRDLEVGAEYRILSVREAQDRRQGWLTELTWEGIDYLRLGVGYNFTDFSDDEFSENDYSTQGWFLRVQGKY